MSWGLAEWGAVPYGGWSIPGAGPFLVDTNPYDGEPGVDVAANVSIIVDSTATIDSALLSVYFDGVCAISAGTFQTGYSGTITAVTATAYQIDITGHPAFSGYTVDVLVDATDLAAVQAFLPFSFALADNLARIEDLTAKSWCAGKRIDLAWTLPGTAPRYMKILRSKFSYAKLVTDPADTLYTGVGIEAFVDGVYTGPIDTTNAALEEDCFYYYTIFLSDSLSGPWYTTADAQVGGLSIKDYFEREGYYVYNLLPSNFRRADQDEARGSDRYKLRDYSMLIQCGTNLVRGWAEGAVKLKDPDRCPAGRIGVASNQTGILQAHLLDMGFTPEKSFDSGVLRRLALGLVSVYQKKGSCPSFVLFAKILTGWDTRCDEVIEPQCGVNRLASTWDGESYILVEKDSYGAGAPVGAIDTGGTALDAVVDIPKSAVKNALETAVTGVPVTDTVSPVLSFIIDAMGTWACVKSSVEHPSDATKWRVTLRQGSLRSYVTGTGTDNGGNLWTIDNSDNITAPWQYASGVGTQQLKWGTNAWAGYQILINGTVYNVVSSAATSGGTTQLTLDATPGFSGAYTLAKSFNGTTPEFAAKLYVGNFSLTFDPRWDYRLVNEPQGPFSLLTSFGGGLGFSLTPADVLLWVKGIGVGEPAEVVGLVTSVTAGTLTDSTAAWTANQWLGYYLIPNWDQTRVYKIVANSGSTLYLQVGGKPPIDQLAKVNSTYVIITEENALKYTSLNKRLPEFVPYESRAFIRYEA